MLTLLLAACAGRAPAAPGPPDGPLPAPVDHHVHVLGPGLVRDWRSLGTTFSRPDEEYTSVDGLLGSGGPLAGALLVPMAHLYGNAEFRTALGLSLEEEERRVRAENDHVAAEAARWPGRAAALASVDLLRPYALAELERARTELGVAGAKVHLASAGFDPRDAEHLAALERVAAWVEAHGLLLLVHLDFQREGIETEDVRRLLERCFGPHPDLDVVVAHLGGSGGFGPWTRAVLATCTRWLADEAAAGRSRPGIAFDLAAVPLWRESEGMPASTDPEIAALAPALRRLGLERVVFGSDYPVLDPREHARLLAERTGLTHAELAGILARRVAALAPAR